MVCAVSCSCCGISWAIVAGQVCSCGPCSRIASGKLAGGQHWTLGSLAVNICSGRRGEAEEAGQEGRATAQARSPDIGRHARNACGRWCGSRPAKAREAFAGSGLQRPALSRPRTTSRHLRERSSSGYVRFLASRAMRSAVPTR